jgi:hypothetical protein
MGFSCHDNENARERVPKLYRTPFLRAALCKPQTDEICALIDSVLTTYFKTLHHVTLVGLSPGIMAVT